jgi:hypothetical protein
MWAALLANASSNMSLMVRPTFIAILKNMAPDEADLLKNLAARDSRIQALEKKYAELFKTGRAVDDADLGTSLGMEVSSICQEFLDMFAILEGENKEATDARYVPLRMPN